MHSAAIISMWRPYRRYPPGNLVLQILRPLPAAMPQNLNDFWCLRSFRHVYAPPVTGYFRTPITSRDYARLLAFPSQSTTLEDWMHYSF